jgi:hypothetical protein
MRLVALICAAMIVAATTPSIAEDTYYPYPDFGSIAKTPPASKEPPPAAQPSIAGRPAPQVPGSQAKTTPTNEDWLSKKPGATPPLSQHSMAGGAVLDRPGAPPSR